MDLLNSIVKTKLKEFGYLTPYAFNPDKNAKGTKNIYYYKLGYKPADVNKLHKQAKGIDHKDLWKPKLNEEKFDIETYVNSLKIKDPKLKKFIFKRILTFDSIENKINQLLPLLKSAKYKVIEKYKQKPDFDVLYSTDIAESYIDDLITLFKDN